MNSDRESNITPVDFSKDEKPNNSQQYSQTTPEEESKSLMRYSAEKKWNRRWGRSRRGYRLFRI